MYFNGFIIQECIFQREMFEKTHAPYTLETGNSF